MTTLYIMLNLPMSSLEDQIFSFQALQLHLLMYCILVYKNDLFSFELEKHFGCNTQSVFLLLGRTGVFYVRGMLSQHVLHS